MNFLKTLLVALTVFLMAMPASADEMTDQLMAAMAADGRPAADKERDAARKPAEVLSYLGLESGMTVLDFMAANGYYTELLAGATGPDGEVHAQNNDRLWGFRDGMFAKGMQSRLEGDRLPNVATYITDVDDLGHEGQIDFVMMGLILHDMADWYGRDGAIQALQSVYNAMKPGGILGVIEHVGVEGQENQELHRMEIPVALELLEAAGFQVDGLNENILNNETDDHTLMIFDPSLGRNTDRYIILARRPLG
jgi:predicted methyltransferase